MNTEDELNQPASLDPPAVSAPPTLQFSDAEPALVVGTCQELDQALHRIELRCTPRHPVAVTLQVHGHRLEIGLGLPNSFVSLQRCEPTPGPGLISVGEARVDWGSVFFFNGWRRTEVPERNLLPAGKARRILREFFQTGTRSTSIEWEAL